MLLSDQEKNVMLLPLLNSLKSMPKNSNLTSQKWWKDYGEITISTLNQRNGKKMVKMKKENH